MLQNFSDRIRNSRWLGYLIVGLISVPFALWGIQSYLGGGSTDAAAEVNGNKIPVYQVQRIASQQRQSLRQRFGGSLPEAFSEQLFLQRALDQLIQRELLRQAAVDAGFRVTDATLRRSIRQQQMFRRDGKFDSELYRRLLSRSGLSTEQYEADVRAGYRIEQLRRGIVDSGFVTSVEARDSARLLREERNLALLVYPGPAAGKAVTLDDEALRAYYEQHRDAFQTPARVRVAYLELDMAALRSQIELDEKDLRAEYRANPERYNAPEERKAAHILLKVDKDAGPDAEQKALSTARELRARLADGADFADLAREYSDDAGSAEQGGRLGYVARGTMVDAFEKALYGLKDKGDVSKPVRTPYGYHLIKLLDVRAGKKRSFEQVRGEIEKELRDRRAERLFYDRVEVLRNTTYEQPGSLEPAADATGLQLRHSEWFSRGKGEGIAATQAVREAAFSPQVREQRLNSDLIELGERRVVVLRVDEEKAAQPKPFEAVRDEVEQRLRAERTDRLLRDWAERTQASIAGGAKPADLATEPVKLRDIGWVARGSGEVGSAVEQAAFRLPAPAAGKTTHDTAELKEGGRAVVIVRGSRLPEVDQEAVAGARKKLLQATSANEIGAYTAALRKKADIVRNEKALSR